MAGSDEEAVAFDASPKVIIFSIRNDAFCIENDAFCIENDDL